MSETTRKNEVFEAQHKPVSNDQVSGGLSFDIPAIDVPLPSLGKVYPEDHPLNGKQTIQISGMTAAQENILTNRNLAKRGELLTHFIQSCLKDRTVNAKDLLIGDRSVIMVALRASGYGPDYNVGVKCPECEAKLQKTIMLDKLPVNSLNIEPVVRNSNLFEFVLPQSKYVVHFKFLTGGDEEEIAKTSTQKKKLGAASDTDLVTSGLLQSIVSINGLTDRGRISLVLPKMPAFDSRALRTFIQSNEPGMQLRAPFECDECQYEGEVDVPIAQEFFWPRTK